MKRKIAKVEDKVTDAQRELDAARHAYAQAAWDAYSKKSTPTTSDKLAQADPQDVGKRLAREQRDSE